MHKELYDKYRSVSDDLIRNHLSHIKIVMKFGDTYVELNDKSLEEIKTDPRSISPLFDTSCFNGKIYKDFVLIKKIDYLCKCSRFFLKPDIGEVFGQMSDTDIKKTNAICLNSEYERLNNDGDEFLMNAELLAFGREKKLERILK